MTKTYSELQLKSQGFHYSSNSIIPACTKYYMQLFLNLRFNIWNKKTGELQHTHLISAEKVSLPVPPPQAQTVTDDSVGPQT